MKSQKNKNKKATGLFGSFFRQRHYCKECEDRKRANGENTNYGKNGVPVKIALQKAAYFHLYIFDFVQGLPSEVPQQK